MRILLKDKVSDDGQNTLYFKSRYFDVFFENELFANVLCNV